MVDETRCPSCTDPETHWGPRQREGLPRRSEIDTLPVRYVRNRPFEDRPRWGAGPKSGGTVHSPWPGSLIFDRPSYPLRGDFPPCHQFPCPRRRPPSRTDMRRRHTGVRVLRWRLGVGGVDTSHDPSGSGGYQQSYLTPLRTPTTRASDHVPVGSRLRRSMGGGKGLRRRGSHLTTPVLPLPVPVPLPEIPVLSILDFPGSPRPWDLGGPTVLWSHREWSVVVQAVKEEDRRVLTSKGVRLGPDETESRGRGFPFSY